MMSGSWRSTDLSAAGKVEAGLGVHLDLVGAREPVLHRVFQGHQVSALPVQLGQGPEKGAALSAPGGAGRENDALARFS